MHLTADIWPAVRLQSTQQADLNFSAAFRADVHASVLKTSRRHAADCVPVCSVPVISRSRPGKASVQKNTLQMYKNAPEHFAVNLKQSAFTSPARSANLNPVIAAESLLSLW